MSDHILVVEDEASIRTIVEYALRDAGFSVVGASRGDEALDVVEREAVDLVVLGGERIGAGRSEGRHLGRVAPDL